MIKKFLAWISASSLQNELDEFVSSKHPQSAAEVDYWVIQYMYGRRH